STTAWNLAASASKSITPRSLPSSYERTAASKRERALGSSASSSAWTGSSGRALRLDWQAASEAARASIQSPRRGLLLGFSEQIVIVRLEIQPGFFGRFLGLLGGRLGGLAHLALALGEPRDRLVHRGGERGVLRRVRDRLDAREQTVRVLGARLRLHHVAEERRIDVRHALFQQCERLARAGLVQ